MSLVERLASLISGTRPNPRQLALEHAALDRLFEEVRERAAEGDWRACDVIWQRLCAQLEDHFRFEELQLWPEFRHSSDRAQAEVEELRAEHAEVRATLDRIGIEIELKRVDQAAIERLIAQLRAHAQHEQELFYPWLGARGE